MVKKLPAGDPGSIPGSGKSLEKVMATHSSILAWRIPGTEEPGGLPSMGSHGSDLAAVTHLKKLLIERNTIIIFCIMLSSSHDIL